jgi:hypothetical protein
MTRVLLVGATRSGVGGAEDRQGDADPAGAAPLPRAGRQREHATEVLQDGREPMPRLRRVGLYEYHLRPPGWSGSCEFLASIPLLIATSSHQCCTEVGDRSHRRRSHVRAVLLVQYCDESLAQGSSGLRSGDGGWAL